MHRHAVTARFTFLQGSYWASYCVIIAFSSVYLLSRGFSNAQIGILLSVASLLSAVLQPIFSRIADGLQRLSLRQFTAGLVLLQLLTGVLLFFLTGGKPSQAILYGLLIILVDLILPLCSALGMEALNNGYSLNFGIARGMGSISYGVCSVLFGYLVLWFGERSILVGLFVLNLLLLLSVWLFHFHIRNRKPVAVETKKEGRPFLCHYRLVGLLLVGVVCLFISHNVLNVYTYQIVQPLGGDSGQMGILLWVQSLLELPVMFAFAWMLKKRDSRLWLRISGISFFLHALGTWISPNMGILYLMQIFEMLGYALYILASVYYINERVLETERVQGQAWFTMAMTLGGMLASLVGGFLLDWAGVSVLLGFATVTGGAGMVILWVLLGKHSKTLTVKGKETAL